MLGVGPTDAPRCLSKGLRHLMLQNMRYAFRALMRRPGFTLVAVLTLALGVGVNTAVFSVADSVLFEPLPFGDVQRLAVLRVANAKTGDVYGTLSVDAIDAARARWRLGPRRHSVPASVASVYATGHRPGRDRAGAGLARVSRSAAHRTGARPLVQRVGRRRTHAVLLFHRAWIKRYGGDPAVVGRSSSDRATHRELSDRRPGASHRRRMPRLRLPIVADADGVILDNTLAGGSRAYPPLVRLAAGLDLRSAQARLSALHLSALAGDGLVLRLARSARNSRSGRGRCYGCCSRHRQPF